jgi:hypothetical protein
MGVTQLVTTVCSIWRSTNPTWPYRARGGPAMCKTKGGHCKPVTRPSDTVTSLYWALGHFNMELQGTAGSRASAGRSVRGQVDGHQEPGATAISARI